MFGSERGKYEQKSRVSLIPRTYRWDLWAESLFLKNKTKKRLRSLIAENKTSTSSALCTCCWEKRHSRWLCRPRRKYALHVCACCSLSSILSQEPLLWFESRFPSVSCSKDIVYVILSGRWNILENPSCSAVWFINLSLSVYFWSFNFLCSGKDATSYRNLGTKTGTNNNISKRVHTALVHRGRQNQDKIKGTIAALRSYCTYILDWLYTVHLHIQE